MTLRATYLIAGLLGLAACGQHTDTTLSDSASGGSSGLATGGSSGDPATDTLTGGLTDGDLGTSDGASTGPGPQPGTGTGTATDEPGSTSLTTGAPQTTGATATTGDDSDSGDSGASGESGETGTVIEDCEDLKAAFASEGQEIRSCSAAEQCGQELTGTSCGCTHNWVARLDADTDHFYELLAMADALRCELVLAGTCDCPPADGFACVDGSCAWNYL